jgi:hypothetical protein
MGLFGPSLSKEEKQNLKLKKKLQKYTKNIQEATDINNQKTGVFDFKRITPKEDNDLAGGILKLILYIGLIVILAFVIIGIVKGDIPVYNIIINVFKK